MGVTHSSCYKLLIIANAVFDAALVVTICMSDLLRSMIPQPNCKDLYVSLEVFILVCYSQLSVYMHVVAIHTLSYV